MVAHVLFVGGLGRSGSTVLELLLAQSPDVCAVGEVVHLWERALRGDERCGCGERFSACPFWQLVGDKAFGSWDQVDPAEVAALKTAVDRTRHIPRLGRATLPPALASAVRRYTDLYAALYRAALDVTGASVVVDSSKHASLAYALRWAPQVDLRVLHLVRDSRAVAHSWARQVRRPEVVDAEAYMPTFSPLRVSALWTVQNLAFDRLARRVATDRLRYEDFVRDPRATIRSVRALAGLPDSSDAIDAVDADDPPRPAHTVAGNPLRFAGGPLRVRADEAWRTAMPRRERLVVGLTTLPLRVRYGYVKGRS